MMPARTRFAERVVATLVVLAVLGSGVLAGMAIERRRAPAIIPSAGVGIIFRLPVTIPTELKQLHLSTAQTEQVESILVRGKARTTRLMSQVVPQFAAVADSTDREIRDVLSAEQRRQLGDQRKQMMIRVLRDSLGKRHVDTVARP